MPVDNNRSLQLIAPKAQNFSNTFYCRAIFVAMVQSVFLVEFLINPFTTKYVIMQLTITEIWTKIGKVVSEFYQTETFSRFLC